MRSIKGTDRFHRIPRNATPQDAWDRLAPARCGSLAGNPSAAYLDELEVALLGWIDAIREFRALRARAESARDAV